MVVNRNNSMLGTLSAVKAGIGVAPLPTTLGDAEETLVDAAYRRLVDHVLGDIPALRMALIG